MVSRSCKYVMGGFKTLTSLTVYEEVIKDLNDCCRILGYLPCLEEIEVNFSPQSSNMMNEEMEDGSIGIKKNNYYSSTSSTLQKVTLLYNLTSIQRDDILHVKKFTNFSYLNISFLLYDHTTDIPNTMMERSILEYIHSKISSYKITFEIREGNETRFLDFYYNGM
jgi:hypothetical protein